MGRGIDLGKIFSILIIIVGALYFNSKIAWETRSLTFLGSFEIGIIILLLTGFLFSKKTNLR